LKCNDEVSTFAWFSVTNSLTVTKSVTGNNSIGVAATNVAADSAVLQNILKVDVKEATKTAVTGLAHYNASATGSAASQKLSTAYIDANGVYHGINGDGGKVLYAPMELTITFETSTGWSNNKYTEGGITYTFADILAELKKQTLTVKILESASSRLRLFTTTASENDPYADGAPASRTGTKVTLSDSVSLATALADVDGLTTGTKPLSSISVNVSGSYNFYVYGGAAANADAETETVNGNIDVDITSVRS